MGKEDANEVTIQELGEKFGIGNVSETSNEVIMNRIMRRMLDINKEGGNTAATELSVELTAVAGGLLLAMKAQEEQGVSKIGELDQTKINGNQKTISEILKTEYKTNFAKAGEDFIINIAQLRKTISEKGARYDMAKRKDILDALASGNLKWKE